MSVDNIKLYKALKRYNDNILKYYKDTSLSDDEYFLYAINYDITSNALNILTNIFMDNLESSGVDLSCRCILEAFIILKMNESGAISEEQKKIFKQIYANVDYDNFNTLASHLPDNHPLKKYLESISIDRQEVIGNCLTHFGCERKDLFRVSIDDPCIYLKTNKDEDTRFVTLIAKYPPRNEYDYRIYNSLSLFIHPRCDMNQNALNEIFSVRNMYVDEILVLVWKHLESKGLLDFEEESVSDFDYDFIHNPVLKNNLSNINQTKQMFDYLQEAICNISENETDIFTLQFLKRIKLQVVDMMLSLSLGYKEHTIACYKSFIEEFSVFHAIESFPTHKEREYLKKAYWITTKLQFKYLFDASTDEENLKMRGEIDQLYLNYYKTRYQLKSSSSLYENMKMNDLHFLTKHKKSFNRFVKTLNEDANGYDEDLFYDARSVYSFSKDLSHASGYSFNSSVEIVNLYAYKTLFHTFNFLVFFVKNSSIALNKKNAHRNLRVFYDFFKSMRQIYSKQVERLINK